MDDSLGEKVFVAFTPMRAVDTIYNEAKLAQMLARNPLRMDYYKKYQEIIADYNR
jgi:type I restriction enzyme R subunit